MIGCDQGYSKLELKPASPFADLSFSLRKRRVLWRNFHALKSETILIMFISLSVTNSRHFGLKSVIRVFLRCLQRPVYGSVSFACPPRFHLSDWK